MLGNLFVTGAVSRASSADGGGTGKIVYRLHFRSKRGRTNSYRTSGYVESHNLREPHYALLTGSLEEGE